jgi:hypothetical protein
LYSFTAISAAAIRSIAKSAPDMNQYAFGAKALNQHRGREPSQHNEHCDSPRSE